MPGLEEVLFYLRGILALIRGDAAGWRNLDLSQRGVNRSFWAIGWSLPGMLVAWLSWRATFIEYGGVGDAGTAFLLRLGMLDLTIWMLKIVVAALLLLYLKMGRHFNAMVVATNWLEVPFSLYTGLLAALQLLFPNGMVLWWILLNIELAAAIYASFAIYRMMKGISVGPAIALAVSTLLVSLMIAPIFQSALGLSL